MTNYPGSNPRADAAFTTFEKVHYDYLRQLVEIWDETVNKILVAQREHCHRGIIAPRQGGVSEKAGDSASSGYVDAVRAAWRESQERYTRAYADYVRAYSDAWVATNLPDVPPQTMYFILQSASTAVDYARATIGNWSLIAWSGVPPWLLTSDKETNGPGQK